MVVQLGRADKERFAAMERREFSRARRAKVLWCHAAAYELINVALVSFRFSRRSRLSFPAWEGALGKRRFVKRSGKSGLVEI